MKLRTALIMLAAMVLIAPNAYAKKKPPKTPPPNWTSTTGVVASGSPQSHGTPAAAIASDVSVADSSAAVATSIPNLGCPSIGLPQDVETVVAQGTASAPSGSTAPTWELTINGNVVLENQNVQAEDAHIISYIGVAGAGCVDFASCSPTLTSFPLADVRLNGQTTNQTVVPYIMDTGGTLTLSETAVFFVTVKTTATGPQGALSCSSASFIPVAHNIAQ